MENIILKNVFAEMSILFNYIDYNLITKVPLHILECIENEKNPNHKIVIDPNKSLDEQNLLKETFSLLTVFKLDYWCDDEKEKKEILAILNNNEEKYQTQLKEKYNPDNIFKNNQSIIDKNTSTQNSSIPTIVDNEDGIDEKNNIFTYILKKIKIIINKIKLN